MRKFLLTALLCLPVSAVSQTIPSCEKLVSELAILTISEGELAQQFYEGKASAERCTFGDFVVCDALNLGEVAMGSWESRDGLTVAKDVRWPGGRLSGAQISESEWTLDEVHLPQYGLHVQRIVRTNSSCHRTGLRFSQVEVEEISDQDVRGLVRVDSLPISRFGLLPPRVRIAEGDLEGSVFATLMQFGEARHVGVVGLTGNFSPGGWFGGGLTFASVDVEGRPQWMSLELNVDEDLSISTLGTLAMHGEDSHRLGGTLEIAPSRVWSLRRLENNAWRSTQESVVGVSLRGSSHELTLGTGIFGNSDLTDVFLRFGSSVGTNRWKTHLDLEHLSTRAPTQVKHAHSSVVGVRVEHEVLRGATSLKPFMDIVANFGVIPTEVGFEASTSAALMPGADFSTTVIGRFESGRHILRPRIFGSAEVYGFTQRGILSPDETPFPFTRRPGLYHGWAGLDQEWQGAVSFRAPLGVHVQGDSSEEIRVSPIGELRLDIQSIRVGGAVRCAQECQGVEWRSYLGLENEVASVEVGAQDHSSWWAPSPGAGPQRRWSHLHQSEQELGLLVYATGSGRLGRTFSNVRLLTDFEEVGVSFGTRWNFTELGWAWGAEAAITPAGEWLGFLGLQMAR